MAATIPVQIGSDLWNARIYASLAAASELVSELATPEGDFVRTIDARQVCQSLNGLNDFIARDLSLIDGIRVAPKGISKDKVVAVRNFFLDLFQICERILQISKEISLSGQMKSELELLGTLSERLLDVADWLDALSTPDEIEEKFVAARAELEAGEVVPMAALR